jgi:hypothetical protein
MHEAWSEAYTMKSRKEVADNQKSIAVNAFSPRSLLPAPRFIQEFVYEN